MWEGIVALLKSIPKMMSLIERAGQWIKEKGINDWLDDLDKTITSLEDAKSPEDKRKAARDLASLIRRL